MSNRCTCPAGEERCGSCPNNPKCRYFVPSRFSKWARCGNREVWGTCPIPAKQCPSCDHYKPPGLRGRPREDEFFDPGLDDPRAFNPNITSEELRAETQKRYQAKRKDDPDFKAQRAEYMRQYRQRGKGRASPGREPGTE